MQSILWMVDIALLVLAGAADVALFLMASKREKSGARDHGALEYHEWAGDDIDVKWGVTFLKLLKLKPGETTVFSWIVFKSKATVTR
jgi:uncharacterized protein YbaA (DUF1428 family)